MKRMSRGPFAEIGVGMSFRNKLLLLQGEKLITILYKNHHNTQCWKQCAMNKDKFIHLENNCLMYVFDGEMRLLDIQTWQQLEQYVDKEMEEVTN